MCNKPPHRPVPQGPPTPAVRSPAVSEEERRELQRQGAKAAARGDTRTTNPIERAENTPTHTGEPEDTWKDRSRAWHEGHDAQSVVPDSGAATEPGDDHGRE